MTPAERSHRLRRDAATWQRPAWSSHTALLLLLAGAALTLGLSLARPALAITADAPGATRALRAFGDVESNEAATYRWSLPRSAIALGGLDRTATILTLRMASPRPPSAPPAEAQLTTDAWQVGAFTVGGEWRRYRVLLPPAPPTGEPVRLRVTPWVPGESDQRRLGAAVTSLAAAPAALAPQPQLALAVLGLPRAAALALLPLVVYALVRGLAWRTEDPGHGQPPPRRPPTVAAHLPMAAATLMLIPAALAAAHPLAAARIPDTWLLPGALAVALGLAGARPQIDAAGRALDGAVPERARVAAVLALALGQGVLYQTIVPPWQHYDEPAHFEYAWLYAQLGARPTDFEGDTQMRREVTASMIEHGFYAPEIPVPPLLSDDGGLQLSGGGTALAHQPWYYALLSLPLRLARALDITSQLQIARAVSLGFWMLTVVSAAGAARELAPPGHPLRWLLPLAVASVAPVADLMAAVNNDVPAVALTSLFLWGAARAIRRGLSWRRAAWVFGAAAAAALMKNTGALALAFAPVVCLAAWAAPRRRWRPILTAGAAAAIILPVALIAWDDAGAWYRWAAPTQPAATRAAMPGAPLGDYALRLEMQPGAFPQRLTGPISAESLAQVRGRRATVGGWLWASRPASADFGLLVHGESDGVVLARRFELTTAPTFVAWTAEIPPDARQVQLLLAGVDAQAGDPLEIYLDGALLARGRFPSDATPSFDGPDAAGGIWGEQRFANLARNPSAEDAGPRLRPEIVAPLSRYLRRPLSSVLMSVADLGLSARAVYLQIGPELLDGLLTRFGWGSQLLAGDAWSWLIRGLVLIAAAGCLRWLIVARGEAAEARPALIALGMFAALMWGAALMRVHPLIETGSVLTSARYAFPAIIPTALALAAGWLYAWPARLRGYALALLLAGVVAYSALATGAVWSFYDALR